MPNQERITRAERRNIIKNEKASMLLQSNEKFINRLGIEKKQPRIVEIPDLRKIPRIGRPDKYKDELFTWSEINADREGFWSWNEPRNWTEQEFNANLKGYLDKLTGNTWSQVEAMEFEARKGYKRKRHTYQDIETLKMEPANRWNQLESICIFPTSFKCHVMNMIRIWGIRHSTHYYVVWYERNHQICPKKG